MFEKFTKLNFLAVILITNFNRLLTKDRSVSPINAVKHDWHDYPEEIKQFPNIYGKKAIFPVHGMPQQLKLSHDAEKQLLNHCAELYKM